MTPLRFSVRPFAFRVLAALVLLAASLAAQSANPAPLVNQPLVPTSAAPGSPDLTLTVNGTGFVSTSIVSWNGAPLSTTFVSSRQLTANVPDSNLASASTAAVTVSSPAPGGGTSNVLPFTVTFPTESVTFAPVLHSAGVTTTTILVGDFNGDGNLDLAVLGGAAPSCSNSTGAISILLGNGHGGFTSKSRICTDDNLPMVGNVPFAGVVGDFNNDGKLDLAVIANSGPGCDEQACAVLLAYLGNGDGTFTEGPTFPEPFSGLDGDFYAITAGDFNGDGNLDLAVSYQPSFIGSNVVVFLGNGDGSFNAESELTNAYVSSNSLAVGDFNNDGILDIASVGAGADNNGNELGPVNIFLGNGDGTFTPAASQPNVTLVKPYSASVMTGDFTGDGKLDLAIADPGSTTLTILKGNGDGTFAQVNGEPALPENSKLVGTADFNGDGNLDLVFSTAPNIITLFLGNGDGTFQTGLSQTVNNGQFGGGAVGDFNGDGRLDLAMANSSDTFYILRQTVAAPNVSITLSSGQDPIYVNQPVTFMAAVTASPYSPVGSVTFKQGATVLGTAPLVDGQATFTTTFTKAGSFPIVASYSGDQNYRAKNSIAVEQIVNKYATSIALGVSPYPTVHDQPVTFTATVSSSGGPLPTGKVVFKNGSVSLGSGTLANGVASLTKSHLPVGTLSISATYEGDADSEMSTLTPPYGVFIN